MLNRRQLRIKVLQSLYAHYIAQEDHYVKGESELEVGVRKGYELYVLLLSIFPELKHLAEQKIEDAKNKMLPTESDLDPNQKFIKNPVLRYFQINRSLTQQREQFKINFDWQDDEVFKLILKDIIQSEEYAEFMKNETVSLEEDKRFIIKVFKKYIINAERFQDYIEDKSMFWIDDLDLMASMVIRTVKKIKNVFDESEQILPAFQDETEETQFFKVLYRKVLVNDEYLNELIENKVKKWELDRIALMDVILIKMGVVEAIQFDSIPTKVSMNEYIELSKFFSTPKSNVFVNGILENLFADLKKEGKIKKIGRGLVE